MRTHTARRLIVGAKSKNVHSPTLDTVFMVEETIKKIGACTITELYKALPRTVIYPTLRLIIEYFYVKGFIASDKEHKIVWIYNPALVRKYRARPDLKVR